MIFGCCKKIQLSSRTYYYFFYKGMIFKFLSYSDAPAKTYTNTSTIVDACDKWR